MNYPLISEYVEAVKLAEDNFEELSYLRPVLDAEGQPVMSSGNFAVVFKMRDERDGKLYAVRCFHRDQEGRADSYRLIEEELKDVESPYLVSFRYMDKELFVDSSQTDETEFPVLLMDWVEGITLDKYLRENLDDQYALEMLAYRFSQLAQWLIPQPFAHGDLKPDNILVREDGNLVLVDYDGMYVPAMKGQKARELGSPDFRHPLRTEDDFDEHIDDFPFVSILLSLKAISINPLWLEKYGASDRLLFSEKDYQDIGKCLLLSDLFTMEDLKIKELVSLLILLTDNPSMGLDYILIPHLSKPHAPSYELFINETESFNTNINLLINGRRGDITIEDITSIVSKIRNGTEEKILLHCADVMIPFDTSYFYYNKDKKDKNIWKLFEVEKTIQCSWQIYLLFRSSSLMPAFDHAYNQRRLLFLPEELDWIIKRCGINDIKDASIKYSLYPYVCLYKDNACISCCFWNDWKGLVREYVRVVFNKNKIIGIEVLGEKTLYQYDCEAVL